MVGFSGGGPAGCDRGRVGQQQEQHGGVGQRSQRQADHGEDVQRVRTPVRPGRRLTTGQFPTPRRIRSRRRCPTCWASVRTMASPRPRWVRAGVVPAAAVGLIGGRGTAPPGRAALGRRCSAISSTSANGTSVTRGDHAGVVPRSIRAGRPDPRAGLPVAARWSPGLPSGVLRCSPHRSPARVSDPRDPLPRIHHCRAARGVVDVHRRAACPADRQSAPRVRAATSSRGTPSSPPRGTRPGAEPPVPSAHAAGPREAAAPPAPGAATLGCRSVGRLLSAAGSRRPGRVGGPLIGVPVKRYADDAAGDDPTAWSTRAVGSQRRPSVEPVSRSMASRSIASLAVV